MLSLLHSESSELVYISFGRSFECFPRNFHEIRAQKQRVNEDGLLIREPVIFCRCFNFTYGRAIKLQGSSFESDWLDRTERGSRAATRYK